MDRSDRITDVEGYESMLIKIAYDILEQHIPKNNNDGYIPTFISLGASPSYIIKAMELLSEKLNKNFNPIYIPFSGSYVKAARNNRRIKSFVTNQLTDNDINKYCSYLKQIELTPQLIMEHYKTYQKPFLLFDYIESGKSMLSFLYILETWAEKEKIQWDPYAVKIIDMQFEDNNSLPDLQTPAGNTYPRHRLPIPSELYTLICTLTESNQRFIPSFKRKDWDEGQNYLDKWNMKKMKYNDGRPVSPETYLGPNIIIESLKKESKFFNEVYTTVTDLCDSVDRQLSSSSDIGSRL